MNKTTIKRTFKGTDIIYMNKKGEQVLTNAQILLKNVPNMNELVNIIECPRGTGSWTKYTGTKSFEERTFPDYKQILSHRKTDTVIETNIFYKESRVFFDTKNKRVESVQEIYIEFIKEIIPDCQEFKMQYDFKSHQHCIIFDGKLLHESNSFIVVMGMKNDGLKEELESLFNGITDRSTDKPVDKHPDQYEYQDRGELEEHINEPIEEPIATIDDIPTPPTVETELEEMELTKDNAHELYELVKKNKIYLSFDISSILIDTLLNNKTDEVKKIHDFKLDGTNAATWKQSKALNRIIFGKHYKAETFHNVISELESLETSVIN